MVVPHSLESADLTQRHGKTSTIDAQGVHHYLHQRGKR
jgi:hypothetical protein